VASPAPSLTANPGLVTPPPAEPPLAAPDDNLKNAIKQIAGGTEAAIVGRMPGANGVIGNPTPVDTAPIAGTVFHVNPQLAQRVNDLIAGAPPEIQEQLRLSITSGERTHEQQQAAYQNYLSGGGIAARPGLSWHERNGGFAVDWNGVVKYPEAQKYLTENAQKYGLGTCSRSGSRRPARRRSRPPFPAARRICRASSSKSAAATRKKPRR
jgi:hypothetical protein